MTEAAGHARAGAGANIFRREGQFWTLAYRGRTIRVKDTKGLRDLAPPPGPPRVELHVLDLAGGAGRRSGPGRPAAGDLGELLDAQARAEYRRRLGELDRELDDAEAVGDLDPRGAGAATSATSSPPSWPPPSASAGDHAAAGDPVERARKAVTGGSG